MRPGLFSCCRADRPVRDRLVRDRCCARDVPRRMGRRPARAARACGCEIRGCRYFPGFYYLWGYERVEIRQNQDRRGLCHPDCGMRPFGRVCLPGGGAFFDLRRQLFAAAYQAQCRGANPLPPLPGRKLRAADDRRIQVLRGALQTRIAHRARLYRLVARPDRGAGFAADDASGQHREAAGRQGAADDEPAADDPFGGYGQPAGQEYPRADRPGGQCGQRGGSARQRVGAYGGAGYAVRGGAAAQAQFLPPFRRPVQSSQRGFEHRDLSP